MSYMVYSPPVDFWALVNPRHRFVHMFPKEHETLSLCGLSSEAGAYVPMHGKPTQHCPECQRKYLELLEKRKQSCLTA